MWGGRQGGGGEVGLRSSRETRAWAGAERGRVLGRAAMSGTGRAGGHCMPPFLPAHCTGQRSQMHLHSLLLQKMPLLASQQSSVFLQPCELRLAHDLQVPVASAFAPRSHSSSPPPVQQLPFDTQALLAAAHLQSAMQQRGAHQQLKQAAALQPLRATSARHPSPRPFCIQAL